MVPVCRRSGASSLSRELENLRRALNESNARVLAEFAANMQTQQREALTQLAQAVQPLERGRASQSDAQQPGPVCGG